MQNIFLIQFHTHFKIISAHLRQANQKVRHKTREPPEKNHLAHLQADLDLPNMCPVWGSNPYQKEQ